MEEKHCLLGNTCNILICVDGNNLSFTGRVIYVGLFQLTFIDKYKKIYSFNLMNVVEVEEVKHEEVRNEKVEEENGG
jgi:hypothetical protein